LLRVCLTGKAELVTKESRLRALDAQVRRLEHRLERLNRISYRYSWIRATVVFAGLLASGLAFYFVNAWLFGFCLVVTGLTFGAAIYLHQRVDTSITRHQIWRQNKVAQIARATLDWERIPTTFAHQPRPEHPFEADLDLVGPRSLHRLIDTAVSYEGSLRLRSWLTEPVPDGVQALRRQQLVRELKPLHLFRDKLVMNAAVTAGARKTWKADQLAEWLDRHEPESALRRWLLLFGGFVVVNALLLIASLLGLLPPVWQITFVIYLALWWYRARAAAAAWNEAVALQGALKQLRAVFHQLETFSYRDMPHLKTLCAPFLDRAHRPARYLARLTRLVAAMGVRENPLIGVALNLVLPWDAYLTYRLNQTKAAMASRAVAWMEEWFELEALSSLATFAYLNPGYAFPQVLAQQAEQPFVFHATDLGHPLIVEDDKVCNDLTIPELGWVAIVTGSNMAGKSVLLKTVGVNLALTYAGGPVNAQELRAVLFRMFSSMGITDSVTNGISYFYAEVKRLKALLAELEGEHGLPLLFFIDEIFRGTNNRERLIGSRAYVRALVGKRGAGLIATHDLELAKLADEMPQVTNYHFRDQVVGDRMVFDYTLRPGPCPTTNALKIMQLEGLPVPAGQGEPLAAAAFEG
jgi:hypothetical protein